MLKRLSRLLVCSCLTAASVGRANLLTNGDFESSGASLTSNYIAIGTNALPGWTNTPGNGPGAANYLSATNSTADWIPNPQSGNYCVQLDSSTAADFYSVGGSIAQTVSLTANTAYKLTFNMSAEVNTFDVNNNQVGCTSQINVLLNGDGFTNQNMVNPSTGTTGFQASWNGASKASPEPSWAQWTVTFIPTVSGNLTLTFQDIWVNNLSSSNASLDNINLVVVPEPSTSRLLGIGLAGGAITLYLRHRGLIRRRSIVRLPRLLPSRPHPRRQRAESC